MPRKGENIRKRKDGRWEGRYPNGVDGDGRTKYASVYAKSYAEVKAKLLAAKTQPKEHRCSGTKLYKEVLFEWLETQVLTAKPSTYIKFRNLVLRHIEPALGQLTLAQINTAKLASFMHQKSESGRLDGCGGLSSSYLQSMSLILKSSLAYAALEHYMPPMAFTLKCPEAEQEPVRVLTAGEQAGLEQLMQDKMDPAKLGILLCLYTGLRIGEICALRWGDIDFANQAIHVRHTVQRLQTADPLAEKKTTLVIGPPKSKCSLRSIPVPLYMTELLRAYRSSPDAYVLTGITGKLMEPRTCQYRFERYTVAAGITGANFHVLRHTFATRFIERGGDPKTLSELLGHASVEITLNKYVHPSMEIKREQMDRFSFNKGMDYGQLAA